MSDGSINFLFITADDLNWDSVGAFGCTVPGITPNLDRLAAEGIRFEHAHVTIAVCQPSRECLMTGRYPHRNGAEGFEPIRTDVPTLQEQLHAAGYLNGILGKESHLAPRHKFCWDTFVTGQDLADGAGIGRSPHRYYEHIRAFLERARREGCPFFLMANSHDPHRPFAGSDQERARWSEALPTVRRTIRPEEVEVPGFLPDIPDVRHEVAEYFTSVHRLDETVGEVLRALEEAGFAEDTLVMFLSDNGMAFPFAKTNCYLASTRTPWMVRWPGVVPGGSVESEHFISGIDFMPTILDAAGLPELEGMDGRSFLPLLRRKILSDRDLVFTEFHQTAGRQRYPMRCVQDRRYGYIVNFWADGATVFRNESQSGRSFHSMRQVAETDPGIAGRVELFLHRVPEELYDMQQDPACLHNLIDDPDHTESADRLRGRLLDRMHRTGDPATEAFERRDDPKAWQQFVEQQVARSQRRSQTP